MSSRWSAVVLLHVLHAYPNLQRVVINDINRFLANAYRVVQKMPNRLIDRLDHLQSSYLPLDSAGRKELYLECRDRFNSDVLDEVERSALLMFLNRTCFNGLYRVNSKGKFNVPHGNYAHPCICDREGLMSLSELLQNVTVMDGDFEVVADSCDERTLVYFDPPYRPSEAGSFTSYAQDGFDDAQQMRLARFAAKLGERGTKILTSNSCSMDGFLEQLYAGFHIEYIRAPRSISCNASSRRPVREMLIRNYAL